MDAAPWLVQHTTTGRLYFNGTAPANSSAYPTAPVRVPHGATITEYGCNVRYTTAADGMTLALYRTNGNGTATLVGTNGVTPTASTAAIALTRTGLNETVTLPGRAYYLEVGLRTATVGDSSNRLAVHNCYVRYTRTGL